MNQCQPQPNAKPNHCGFRESRWYPIVTPQQESPPPPPYVTQQVDFISNNHPAVNATDYAENRECLRLSPRDFVLINSFFKLPVLENEPLTFRICTKPSICPLLHKKITVISEHWVCSFFSCQPHRFCNLSKNQPPSLFLSSLLFFLFLQARKWV